MKPLPVLFAILAVAMFGFYGYFRYFAPTPAVNSAGSVNEPAASTPAAIGTPAAEQPVVVAAPTKQVPSPEQLEASFGGFVDRFIKSLSTTADAASQNVSRGSFTKTSMDVEQSPSLLHPIVGKLGVKWVHVEAQGDLYGRGTGKQLSITFAPIGSGWTLIESHSRVETDIGQTAGGVRTQYPVGEEADDTSSSRLHQAVDAANSADN